MNTCNLCYLLIHKKRQLFLKVIRNKQTESNFLLKKRKEKKVK